jgi:alpha-1,3-glucan synthase
MKWASSSALLALLATTATAWPYDESLAAYNLNENKTATNPAEYWGEWPKHKGEYFPSPDNWRMPVYTLFLDRFVNGDPTNDNINGTLFEHDISSTQMRHGGDVAGLLDTLDYLQGMGIKVGFPPDFVGTNGILIHDIDSVSRRNDLDESALGF